MTFQVGDTVELEEGHYLEDIYNPIGIFGTVLLNDYLIDYPYRVEWSNGQTNSYQEGQLILIKGVKERKKGYAKWISAKEEAA